MWLKIRAISAALYRVVQLQRFVAKHQKRPPQGGALGLQLIDMAQHGPSAQVQPVRTEVEIHNHIALAIPRKLKQILPAPPFQRVAALPIAEDIVAATGSDPAVALPQRQRIQPQMVAHQRQGLGQPLRIVDKAQRHREAGGGKHLQPDRARRQRKKPVINGVLMSDIPHCAKPPATGEGTAWPPARVRAGRQCGDFTELARNSP